jgi:hypothetical protein
MDCWCFIQKVYLEEHGIEIANMNVNASSLFAVLRVFRDTSEYDNWVEVTEQLPFDVVLMSSSHQPSHVGLQVGTHKLRVIHCAPMSGVVVDDRLSLRAGGYKVLRFYRHKKLVERVGVPCS